MRGASVLVSLTGVFLFAPNATRAQAPAKFEFEVASVRASAPRIPGQRPAPATRSGGPGTPDPGRVSYSNQPLSDILADAFGVYWNQISGPDWIAAERYDIAAKVPEGYELTLAPGGSKMHAHSDAPAAPQNSAAAKDPFPALAPGEHMARRTSSGHAYARFAETSVSELAKFLGASLSSASMVMVSTAESRGAPPPILDKTGLTGTYDFTFDYAGGVFFAPDSLRLW